MGLFNHQKINYTSPASAQGGPGVSKSLTWYVGTPYIDMTLAQMNALGLKPGDTWWVGGNPGVAGGNCFKVVKAIAALSLGQLVAMADPALSVVAAAPAPTTAAFGWNAGGLTVNAEVGNFVWVSSAAATLPQCREIKANTATLLTVAQADYLRPNLPTSADVFDNVPVAAEVSAIIRPYNVKVCTATDNPTGVALGTVTINNYTVVQVAGLAFVQVDADGGGATAIVMGVQASPTAAGCAVGSAGVTLYNGGLALTPLLASTAAAGTLIPFYVNFIGT